MSAAHTPMANVLTLGRYAEAIIEECNVRYRDIVHLPLSYEDATTKIREAHGWIQHMRRTVDAICEAEQDETVHNSPHWISLLTYIATAEAELTVHLEGITAELDVVKSTRAHMWTAKESDTSVLLG